MDDSKVYILHLGPLARTIGSADDSGNTHVEYEVVLPPYNFLTAALKVTWGPNPEFAGPPHSTTECEPTAADIWATAFVVSPEDYLFQIHRIQNGRCMQRGLFVKAPGAWSGNALIVEKLGELGAWSLLEFRLLACNKTIYVRSLNEYVAMDRTCYGKGIRQMRITARKVWGTFDDVKYDR